MKKNIKELIILIIFTLILFGILKNYNLVIESIKASTNLWLFKLFPSLFPFLVIGSILINYNFAYYFTKIFKVKSNDFIIFILSLLSGFPSSAKYIKDMYVKKDITLNEANNILCFTFFANPLFLLSILSLSFNKKITLFIILSHYVANIVIYLFLKNNNNKNHIIKKNVNLPEVIASSIKDGINTLLLILGTITFYNIFITIFKSFIHNQFLISLITGILEFSQGLNSLKLLNLSIFFKALMAIMFVSFGSFSILTQIKSIISDTNINFKKFVKFRFVHVLIAWSLFVLLYYVL